MKFIKIPRLANRQWQVFIFSKEGDILKKQYNLKKKGNQNH
jgi:hypothetical protein